MQYPVTGLNRVCCGQDFDISEIIYYMSMIYYMRIIYYMSTDYMESSNDIKCDTSLLSQQSESVLKSALLLMGISRGHIAYSTSKLH